VVVVLLVVTGGETYAAGAVVEYSVVVVVGGTSSAQAPTNPTDIAIAAAKATFFRSFMFGLPPLGTFFGNRETQVQRQKLNVKVRQLGTCKLGAANIGSVAISSHLGTPRGFRHHAKLLGFSYRCLCM
jgi:hypothetical protein